MKIQRVFVPARAKPPGKSEETLFERRDARFGSCSYPGFVNVDLPPARDPLVKLCGLQLKGPNGTPLKQDPYCGFKGNAVWISRTKPPKADLSYAH